MNKIVYVEDDSEVGNLIAAWLGKHDFGVIVEPRGDRALEVIEAHAPDLVLLDILLLGKDGMTLCRDLRPRYTGPIVLLTSLDSDMNHVLKLELAAQRLGQGHLNECTHFDSASSFYRLSILSTKWRIASIRSSPVKNGSSTASLTSCVRRWYACATGWR